MNRTLPDPIPNTVANQALLATLGRHSTGSFTGEEGVTIFYQRWLPQAEDPKGIVVLCHGLGEHSDRYGHLVAWLLQSGYGCYASDHRGFGRSEGRRGHVSRFQQYSQDLRRTVDLARAEYPHHHLTLYGHSMGGLISLDYALRYPKTLDALIISAPALYMPPKRRPFLRVSVARILSLVYPGFHMDNGGDSELSREPGVTAAMASDPLATRLITARWAIEFLATINRVNGLADQLNVPLLMLHGEADDLTFAHATQAFFQRVTEPDRTLYLYPDYVHELHNDIGREKPIGDLVAWLDAQVNRPTSSPAKDPATL